MRMLPFDDGETLGDIAGGVSGEGLDPREEIVAELLKLAISHCIICIR
jgi:hypothetical protein